MPHSYLRRLQVSTAALQGLLVNNSAADPEGLANRAVKFADALLGQLDVKPMVAEQDLDECADESSPGLDPYAPTGIDPYSRD